MKLAIIGAGLIVKDFLTIVKDLPKINIQAIVGTNRNVENLFSLKKMYKIKEVYTDIDECLGNCDVDTVYVAVPNNMHYEVVKKSLNAGKHVICEKPFTSNFKELEELYNLAISKGLVLIEAITNQYLPNYKEIKKNIDKIGDIKIVECNYSQLSSRWENFKKGIVAPVFDKSKGGGALVDLNIYNIHFVVGLFGLPKKVDYYPNIVNKVDSSGVLMLDYTEFKAICIAAKDTFDNSYSFIQGDRGILSVSGPNNGVPNYTLKSIDINIEKTNINIHEHRMFSEFYKFIEVIENIDMDFVKVQMKHSMDVMRVVDMARESETRYNK